MVASTLILSATDPAAQRARTAEMLPQHVVLVCGQCRALRDEAVARGKLQIDPSEEALETEEAALLIGDPTPV